jgi:protease I
MKILLVIVNQGFRDEEYFDTKEVLEAGGVKTVTAGLKKGQCQGSQGGAAQAELGIDEVKAAEFDGVVFVGGQGMIKQTRNPELIELAQDFARAGKVVSAICIAPEILAHAGLLKGRQVTSTPMAEDTLRNAGADFKGGTVVSDKRLITGEGPSAAREFGKAILAELKK